MNRQTFLARYCADLPPGLAAAVIAQSGGWDHFAANAPDIGRHGIDAGFHGWIYHHETVRFFEANHSAVVAWIAQTADDFGCEPVAMLQSWRCLQDCTHAEILATIAGTEIDQTVANGLAWGVAEDVARRFADVVGDR
jgi:hypothetical protein